MCCVKIPHDVPFDKACLLGCAVATGVGSVLTIGQVEAGAHVAVIGCGGIGVSIIQGAVLAGAAKIVAIDMLDQKLKSARQFGATHTLNAATEDPITRAIEICEGRVDYAFDVVGVQSTMDQAVNMVRLGGTVVIVGVGALSEKWQMDPLAFLLGKRILGSFGGGLRHRVDVPAYAELYKSGRLNLDDMVSQAIPLEKINEGFEAMEKGEVIRSVIVF